MVGLLPTISGPRRLLRRTGVTGLLAPGGPRQSRDRWRFRGRIGVGACWPDDRRAAGIPTSGSGADDPDRPGDAGRRGAATSGHWPGSGSTRRRAHQGTSPSRRPSGDASRRHRRRSASHCRSQCGRRPFWATPSDPRGGPRADRPGPGGRQGLQPDRGGAPGGRRADGAGRAYVAGLDRPGGASAGDADPRRLRSPPRGEKINTQVLGIGSQVEQPTRDEEQEERAHRPSAQKAVRPQIDEADPGAKTTSSGPGSGASSRGPANRSTRSRWRPIPGTPGKFLRGERRGRHGLTPLLIRRLAPVISVGEVELFSRAGHLSHPPGHPPVEAASSPTAPSIPMPRACSSSWSQAPRTERSHR